MKFRIRFARCDLVLFALTFLAVTFYAGPAIAGSDCTPDAGFERCYQEASWSSTVADERTQPTLLSARPRQGQNYVRTIRSGGEIPVAGGQPGSLAQSELEVGSIVRGQTVRACQTVQPGKRRPTTG